MLGKTPEQLIGKKCYRAFRGREAPCADCAGFRAMATGRPAESESLVQREDGSTFFVRIKASPVLDREGEPAGFIEVTEDVTERKQAENALRESEERYRRLFEVESDAVLLVDCGTDRFFDANAAAVKLYGYSREEFLLLRPEDVSAEPEKTRQSIAACQTWFPCVGTARRTAQSFPSKSPAASSTIRDAKSASPPSATSPSGSGPKKNWSKPPAPPRRPTGPRASSWPT